MAPLAVRCGCVVSAVPQRAFEEARTIVEEYAAWQSGAEARAAERVATSSKEEKGAVEDAADEQKETADKPEAADAESEAEQDKRKKRKAQRAEKVLSVLA